MHAGLSCLLQTGRELPEQRHPVIQAVTKVRAFQASKSNLQAAMDAHPELHNVLLNKLHRKRSNAILVRAMSSFHLQSLRVSEVSGPSNEQTMLPRVRMPREASHMTFMRSPLECLDELFLLIFCCITCRHLQEDFTSS